MKNIVTTLLVLGASIILTACQNSNNGGSTPVCPTGYVYDASANVCRGNGGNNGGGVIPNNGVVQYYDYNRYFLWNGFGVQSYSGDMQIVNAAAYKTFLKQAMGVCDRVSWGYQAGLAKCDSWVSGSFQLSFAMSGNQKPIIKFEAYPATQYYQYAVSFGIDAAGAAYNPLLLSYDTTFNLINQSAGFELRSYGAMNNAGGLHLIQIQVHQGKLGDNNVTYELYYPYNGVATKVAVGKFKRY